MLSNNNEEKGWKTLINNNIKGKPKVAFQIAMGGNNNKEFPLEANQKVMEDTWITNKDSFPLKDKELKEKESS